MVYNLFSLWKTVNPGGLFVVEDIETCYWKSGSKVQELSEHSNLVRVSGLGLLLESGLRI